jgi:hypothetical protein
VALLLAAVAGIAAALASAGSAGTPAPLTGSINLVDKGWTCSGPVALSSVNVTMTQNATGPLQGKGNIDAVHFHSGCTGTIDQLTVVQYEGDGVKVGQGAHDLTIRSGSVRCFGRANGKHQDGVQVMGGRNILFRNFDVECQTSNNAAFFVNQGTQSPEVPTGIVCDGCFLSGGGITVRIYHSVASGVKNSTIVAGHLSPMRIDKASAVDPVNANNTIAAPGTTRPVSPPSGGSGGSTGGSSLTVKALPAGTTLRPRFYGTVGVVTLQVRVGAPATVTVSLTGPTRAPLSLLPKSRVGTATSGTPRRNVIAHATAPATLPVTLRTLARSLVRGRLYHVQITAIGADGTKGSTSVNVRR